MPMFKVATSRKSVYVESEGWLDALVQALPHFGLVGVSLNQLACMIRPDGTVEVVDPASDLQLRITDSTPHSELVDAAVPLRAEDIGRPPAFHGGATVVPRSAPQAVANDGHWSAVEANVDTSPVRSPAPAIADTSLRGEPANRPMAEPRRGADDRVALVFDRCSRIYAAKDVRSACDAALGILNELVMADAGAVLMRTRDGKKLTFVSAVGPRSKKVLDKSIPAEEGIAGFASEFGIGLIIPNVKNDEVHYDPDVDRSTGYHTESVLAVPIGPLHGTPYGCLELLNAPHGFAPEDLKISWTVAAALAGWLQAAAA